MLATHRAVILKSRLAIGSCMLLVKLLESYCIEPDPSFPEPSHALESIGWEGVRSQSLTHSFGDDSLTRLEKA